jgi:hypothetical protein
MTIQLPTNPRASIVGAVLQIQRDVALMAAKLRADADNPASPFNPRDPAFEAEIRREAGRRLGINP